MSTKTNPPFAALTPPLSEGRQKHWDTRAALNFMLGGAGAGLLAFAPFIAPASPWAPALAVTLIGAGLFSVWMEIGRKWRALHVLFNPFTSWMTRESFVAVLLFPLALGAIAVPAALPWAAAAGLAFLYCQARILRASKGVPAWRAPEVVPLVVSTGLAEGAGLALLFSTQAALGWVLIAAVVARYAALRRYRAAPLRLHATVPVLLLAGVGFHAQEALLLAGALALLDGWWMKLALVTRASATQRLALPVAPVRGTR